MKTNRNIDQVVNIAKDESRLIEGVVTKIFPQTRTAIVNLDGSSQVVNIALGHIDPSMVRTEGSRVLLYRTSNAIYPLSAMPGQHISSSPGVTLGDRWGGTKLSIYNTYRHGISPDEVAYIDSRGRLLASDLIMDTYLTLPGLRGFWPMSAFASGGNCYDQSGNGRTLTYNGNPVYGSGAGTSGGLTPWIRFDGTGDYLSRTDEAGLDILGTESYVDVPGLTLGGWFRPENLTVSAMLLGKYNSPGNDRSYGLWIKGATAGDPVGINVSNDGTNYDVCNSASAYSTNTWQFMAGRYDDALTGEELTVWLNSEKSTNTTTIASLKNSAADFTVAAIHGASGSLYTGRASMCFLCAAALSDDIINRIYKRTKGLFLV